MNAKVRADFRSDTVTRPTPEMRRAMAEAVVGDDVLGDDPTVRELEERFADFIGKEAAMFTPSGTMANLAAVLTWCPPGGETVMEEGTHTFRYEGGASCRFGGVQIWTFARPSGVPEPEDFLRRIRNPSDPHQPRTRLFVVENTHNLAGGKVVPLERVREIAELAHSHGARLHLDGARLCNAAAATGRSPAELAGPADSVMCCLSKGLGAPVGSLLAGPLDFLEEARRVRKALGGGMRQAGVLAAAGLVALREGPGRLHEDHARARRFAEAAAEIEGLSVDPSRVETNMVLVEVTGFETSDLIRGLAGEGVLVFAIKPDTLRFVLHRDLDDEALEAGLEALRGVAENLRRGRRADPSIRADTEPW